MRLRRRDTEIFSMSFLDCICCGFGAVLLLFVLTAGRKAETRYKLLTEIEEVVAKMDSEIAEKERELRQMQVSLETRREKRKSLEKKREEKKKLRTELDEELTLLLSQLAALEERKKELLEEKEEIPKVEKKPPIPIPNVIRRQYLTEFKIDGKNVLFVVRASGSMLDDTVEGATARIGDPPEEKREAPKWKRVKAGLKWLIANLDKDTNYKILFFNTEVFPLEIGSGLDWFKLSDREMTAKVLEAIDEVVPEGGANLERAFTRASSMQIVPDRVVLIIDSLPTRADSYEVPAALNDEDRIQMYRAARQALVLNAPVSTILYPLSGDPAAAVHYWRLADSTNGALVCPSRTWPDL